MSYKVIQKIYEHAGAWFSHRIDEYFNGLSIFWSYIKFARARLSNLHEFSDLEENSPKMYQN